MKVGIVGSERSVQDICAMIDPEESFFEFVQYPYPWVTVVELLDVIQKELDAILFTGNHYYSYASINTSATIPWTFPKRATRSVLRILLQALMAGVDISKITYDLNGVTVRQMMNLLCDEAGQNVSDISLCRYNDTQRCLEYIYSSIEGYESNAVAYHLENLRAGRATICLTGSPGVLDRMKQYGYPAFLVQTTEEDLTVALNELRLRHQLAMKQSREEYHLAVIAVNVRLSEVYHYGNQDYRHLHSSHQIETLVYAFAQSMGATVEKQSSENYLIYTTKTEVDLTTERFTKLDLIQKLQSVAYVQRVTMGIGIGATHSIAKNNAQHCAEIARKQERDCYYIMEEDATPSGPFLVKQDSGGKEFSELLLDRISEQTGVGTVVLNTLAKAQAQYGFTSITSGKLAKMCGMTVSNMNRVIAKLEAAGYAQVVGSHYHNGAGRPSRLINLKLGNASS